MRTNKSVETLNDILRGEISAVETYDQALEKIEDASIVEQLRQCRSSHQMRVSIVRAEIARRGGEPASGSGPWGTFAKLVEGGAKAIGEKAAISVLEQGEDHGLKQYAEDLPKLDEEARWALEQRLLVAQQETHNRMSALKHTFH
jgi:hypothetical protein